MRLSSPTRSFRTFHRIHQGSTQQRRVGPDKIDIIQGRVLGARPGQQIVLYSKSGAWLVQPLVNEAFTKIQPDSKWINTVHLGTEYTALLVEPGYHPPATMNVLPTTGGGVVAVAIAKGGSSGPSISKTLNFSGYEWRIRDAPSDRGGQNNYDPKQRMDGLAWCAAHAHSEDFGPMDVARK